jgi:hypothetical protein
MLGVALIESPKTIFTQTPFILVDVQGIYVNKIDSNFYEKILSGSAPLGASTKNSEYFVSDWTGDSYLTHYLTSKTMGF